jgi:muconolactone delta-isomerase
MMKFLISVRRRDNAMIPPDVVAGMLHAQADWLDEKIADGTFDVAYARAQGAGGFVIANADTAEELNATLVEAPLFPITDVDVTPLADIRTSLENGAKALRRGTGVPA